MQDPVQEIKDKLSIEDVVSSYVTLTRAGRYLKAACPFHAEKTPSFFVNIERQIAYCFSCQKGGDVFRFIQEIEGLDFRGALELLADRASVELPKGEKIAAYSRDKKDEILAIYQAASNFFVQTLGSDANAMKVKEYVFRRGISEKTINDFCLGFAPDSADVLYRHLLEKKFSRELLFESGLFVSRDSEGLNMVDRFRLRLMFPIRDLQGRPIAFGARALKAGDQPKYLNSSDSMLYHKGSVLYNLDKAKSAIKESGFALVVEGYFDVMASYQAGIFNVVASSGTAFTEAQLKLLKRYASKLVLAFDSDEAGKSALLRAVLLAQNFEFEIYVISFAGSKDAADMVKENPELWRSAVEARQPYLDYFFEHYSNVFDLKSVAGRREFTDAFLEILKGVPHPVEKDHYLKRLSAALDTSINLLYDYLNSIEKKEKKKVSSSQAKKLDLEGAPSTLTRKSRLLRQFIGLILLEPSLLFELEKELRDRLEFDKILSALPMVKRLERLNAGICSDFLISLEKGLPQEDLDFDPSSVYKDVKDYYTRTGELDSAFYEARQDGHLLQALAFELELNTPKESKWLKEEFIKLLAHLALDFTS